MADRAGDRNLKLSITVWRVPNIHPPESPDRVGQSQSRRCCRVAPANASAPFCSAALCTAAHSERQPHPVPRVRVAGAAEPAQAVPVSIIIRLAFGTSTPTSITVVAINSWISFALKACMTASFSAGFIRPCTSPTRKSGSATLSSSHVASAAWASSRSDSSINVQTQ